MTISQHEETFESKKVVDFTEGSTFNMDSEAVKISVGYDDAEDGGTMLKLMTQLCEHSQASSISHLVIGEWEECFDSNIADCIELLTKNKNKFPALEAIFIGDITGDECEMSWIQQIDYKNFLAAFSQLKTLRIRGGTGLDISEVNSENLTRLILETGGLNSKLLQHVIDSNLPQLTHLELWLGIDDYGWDGSIAQIEQLVKKFGQQVTYLGLKNSEITDEMAMFLCQNTELWSNVKTLDLSMGTLSDVGGEQLLKCESLSQLDFLNLSHHYLSDEMMAKLKGLTIKINLEEQEDVDVYDDEEYRYVAVGE